jgi:TRAP-type C4-dicarboxylate transport system permease small subunit
MKAFMLKLDRWTSRLSQVALYLAAIGLVLMTVAVAYVVYGRYVINRTPNWAEALPEAIMAWFIFLGAAVGVREKVHLGFDVLVYLLPPGGKIVLRALSDLFAFVFGVGMIFYGWKLAALTWQDNTPTLGVPGGLLYIPVIVGGLLICIFTAERSVARLAGVPVDQDDMEVAEGLSPPAPEDTQGGAS